MAVRAAGLRERNRSRHSPLSPLRLTPERVIAYSSHIMQEAPAPSAPRIRRGRPPRFSREQIVIAAADLLRGDPPTPLTMGRVAAALGASPMSLYRYFADRDDLVMAVTRHVMSLSRVDVPEDATWEVQLAAWMTSVYDQALRHPNLLHISAAAHPASWASESALL